MSHKRWLCDRTRGKVVARHWSSRLTTASMIWADAPAYSLRVCPLLARSLTGCGRTTHRMQAPLMEPRPRFVRRSSLMICLGSRQRPEKCRGDLIHVFMTRFRLLCKWPALTTREYENKNTPNGCLFATLWSDLPYLCRTSQNTVPFWLQIPACLGYINLARSVSGSPHGGLSFRGETSVPDTID